MENKPLSFYLDKVRHFAKKYVSKSHYQFYPDKDRVKNIIQGLAINLRNHGKMYCPCAPVEEAKLQKNNLVCPCQASHRDIKEQGYCDCAFFVSSDFLLKSSL